MAKNIRFTTLSGDRIPLSEVYAIKAAYRNPPTEEIYLSPDDLLADNPQAGWMPWSDHTFKQDLKGDSDGPWMVLRTQFHGKSPTETVIRAREIAHVSFAVTEVGGCPLHSVHLKGVKAAKVDFMAYECYQPGPYQAHEAVERYGDIQRFCALHNISFGLKS